MYFRPQMMLHVQLGFPLAECIALHEAPEGCKMIRQDVNNDITVKKRRSSLKVIFPSYWSAPSHALLPSQQLGL